MTISYFGDLGKTKRFLMQNFDRFAHGLLNRYGRRGVRALQAATPTRTGKTASSWSYEIIKADNKYELTFNNANVNRGENIAILIQYGHGTATGGYVPPTDYINPALSDIFKALGEEIVRSLNNG